MAARLGGLVRATNSWLMPGKLIPSIPTPGPLSKPVTPVGAWWTHGWVATASITS
jgi:hypothetical protein